MLIYNIVKLTNTYYLLNTNYLLDVFCCSYTNKYE